MVTKKETWKEAARLIRLGWCQRGQLAVDKYGRGTSTSGPEAVAWCAWGALRKVCTETGEDDGDYIRALEPLVGGAVARWNDSDTTTQELVASTLEGMAE